MFFTDSYIGPGKGVQPKEHDWTLDELHHNIDKYPYLCEYLKIPEDQLIKPYVDFDLKLDNLPSESEIKKLYNCVERDFSSRLSSGPIKIVKAWREPAKVNELYKVSLRLWAVGVATTKKELKELFKNYIPDITTYPDFVQTYDFKGSFFDCSVYSNDRKMNFVGKAKNPQDLRALLFDSDLSDYVIQHVEDNYERISPVVKKAETKSTLSKAEEKTIKTFVTNNYQEDSDIIGDVILNKEYNIINVALSQKYCNFEQREHVSNHQYIVIDNISAKQKCHDADCENLKHNEIQFPSYPKTLQTVIKKHLQPKKSPDSVVNQQFMEKYKEGTIVDIKYKNDTVAGKIVNNKDLRLKHFLHKEHCRGDLFYNINIDKDVNYHLQKVWVHTH